MNQTESSGVSTLTKIIVKWLSQETAKHVEDESFFFVPVSGPHCLYITCLTQQRLTLILGSMANIPSSH